VRMSKRAGTYITLPDLIEEVGRDAVRFTMLTRKSDAQMEFDIGRRRRADARQPVFYVQYAHAAAAACCGRRRAVRAEKTTDAALAATPLIAWKTRRSWRWSGACWLAAHRRGRRPGATSHTESLFPL